MNDKEAARLRHVEQLPPHVKAYSDTLRYIKLLDLFRNLANHYADEKQELGFKESRKNIVKRASLAFERIYSTKDDCQEREQIIGELGEEGLTFNWYLNHFSQDIKRCENTYEGKETVTVFEATKAAYQVAKTALANKDISWERKAHVLSLAGYKEGEIPQMLINLGISGGVWGVNAIAYGTTLTMSSGFGALHPFLEDITNPSTQLVVAASYLAHYSMLGLNAYQGTRMLKSEMRNSINVVSTAVYFLLEKFLPPHAKTRDIIITIIPMIPFIIEEIGFIGGLFIYPSVTASRNLGMAAINGLEASACEIGLRAFSRRNKKRVGKN